jgi:uncharacterized protein (TIGR04551 family)
MLYKTSLVAIILATVMIPELASAQVTPGMGGGPGGFGGPQQPSGDEKKEGVAEAAPKQPGLLPTTPALPTAKGRRKRWKLFEMDGYYRMRTDWFKNFNLGFNDDPTLGGAPFPRALGCTATALNHPCDDSLASANMRLRLEPTINLDEGTSVHIQADVFDNLVLGSTPLNENLTSYTDANKPPLGAFGNTQSPPVQGVNSDRDSIIVKRAWGEVAVPLGILKFGRMPDQWGMGMFHNAGARDPISGTYNYDADAGDTVDRVSFSALIPGTQLRAMVAMDWDLTRLVSNQMTSTNKGHETHPFDLDDSSDTNGWVAVLSKMDSPQEFRDTVDRGELALNYGVYFEYKTQSWDENLTNFNGQTFNSATQYVPRDFKTYTPDVWLKLGYGPIQFEAEFVAQLGRVDRLDDYQHVDVTGTGTTGADIRKYGGVGRFSWRGLENKLHLGIESGFATGDQFDNTPQGNTNIAFANLLGDPTTTKLTQFMFNRDYFVDLILFRHLIGSVTNAVYAKPFLSYDLTKNLTFKVSNITSFALKPVSTPGNGTMYGTEFDGEIGFNAGGIYASIAYGVLFPFGAMAHPEDIDNSGGPGFHYGTDPVTGVANTGDPGTAHTIQIKGVLAF